MSVAYEVALERFFEPASLSDGSTTINLCVNWKHWSQVFQPTNHGILPPAVVEELIGDSHSSEIAFYFPPLSEFRQRIRMAIEFLDFPHALSNFLCDKITSIIIDFVADSPTGLRPSLVLVADINFIHRVYADFDPRSLEIPPLRQLAASADENWVPDTTTEGPEITFILRGPTEGWGGDGGDFHSFFDENFILGIPSEVDEGDNAGTEMLGEVNCSICLDEFSEGQEVMTMACEHTYHEQCLLTWLNRNQTCPLCRRPL